MKDPLAKYKRLISKDSIRSTSLLESAYGLTHCDLQDGPTIRKSGRRVVLVNRSLRPAKGKASKTIDIFGRSFSDSLEHPGDRLSLLLASRLQAKMDLLGSTMYKLTWKARTTLRGRLIPALRASALPISAKDCTGPLSFPPFLIPRLLTPWITRKDYRCGQEKRYLEAVHAVSLNDQAMLVPSLPPTQTPLRGWASPQSRDHKGARTSLETQEKNSRPLNEQAVLLVEEAPLVLAPWPTAKASDGDDGRTTKTEGGGNSHLQIATRMAPWPTPMAGNPGSESYNEAGNTDSSRKTVSLLEGQPTASGETLHGFSARTGSTGQSRHEGSQGQLNPGLSRWLMSLPEIWDLCALETVEGLKKEKREKKAREKEEKSKSSGRSSRKAKPGQ